MLLFPNAKINLGLQITGRRSDGYHNISTIFYPVAVTDMLEAIRSTAFSFRQTGLAVDGPDSNNLCVKAWKLLQQRHDLPAITMHLHKQIPMGAGLGGGSSDAASTLLLLDKLFQLQLPAETLSAYALELGSDCPFFLLNQPAYATGRGEQLEPVSIPNLRGKQLVLINPGIHVATGWAFAQVSPTSATLPLKSIVAQPLAAWKGQLVNDFETPVFAAYPELLQLRNRLYQAGAVFAGMSGSGSTLFGIFDQAPDIGTLALPNHYRHWTVPA